MGLADVLVLVAVDAEFLIAGDLARVVVGEQLGNGGDHGLGVLAGDQDFVLVLGFVGADRQGAVVLDDVFFVVADGDFAVYADVQ